MTCPNDGENMKKGLDDFFNSLAAFPGMAGFIGQGIKAKASGQKFDPSTMDYAGATNIDGTVLAGTGSALSNLGQKVAGAAVSNYSDVKDFKGAYDAAADANPDGGAGPCDDDDDDDNPGEPGNPDNPGSPGNPGGGDNPGRVHGSPPSGRPPQPIDPLVIDLDGDGVELTSAVQSGAYFDYDGDGYREQTGWVDGDDGILVLDKNGNRVVDDVSELFGTAARDGFDVLADYDSNGDGVINKNDSAYSSIEVWQDLNGDGISQDGELNSLKDLGIHEIGLSAKAVGLSRNGNWIAKTGTASSTSGEKVVESVYFAVNKQNTSYTVPNNFKYNEDALALPNLKGYGQIRDLSVAATQDANILDSLKSLVLDSEKLSPSVLLNKIEQFITDWVGAPSIEQGSRGSYVSYEKLAVLEKFWGEKFWENDVTDNGSRIIEESYNNLISSLSGRLLVQMASSFYIVKTMQGVDVPLLGHPLSAFSVFSYNLDNDSVEGRIDHFVALATSLLKGSYFEKLEEFENLLKSGESVSSSLFGNPNKLGEAVAKLVSSETNASGIGNIELIALARGEAKFGDNLSNRIEHVVSSNPGALFGHDGDDALIGGHASDYLFGGHDDDLMLGNGGDDTYVYELGDGADTIRDYSGNGGWGGNDTIQLGAGITTGSVIVTQADNGREQPPPGGPGR